MFFSVARFLHNLEYVMFLLVMLRALGFIHEQGSGSFRQSVSVFGVDFVGRKVGTLHD